MTDDKYKNVSSKLSKYSIERLTRIAQKKGMSIYTLIQMVCDTSSAIWTTGTTYPKR